MWLLCCSGARGLGYNMASALCECGVKAIAILDVLQDHGDDAIAELHQKYGVAAAFYKIDVRDAEAVSDVMDSVGLPDFEASGCRIDSNDGGGCCDFEC